MSTDTLFRSIPTASLNDPPKTEPTTSRMPAPVLLDAPVVTTPSVLTPNVELNNTNLFPNTTTTTLPAKKDISSIPPSFFVGPSEKEDVVIFEPEFNTGSGSVVSYGDRRLSGILAEANDKREEENKEDNSVPVKKVVLGTADANRGIFGDKKFKVNNNSTTDSQLSTIISEASFTTSLQPSRTVRVFGYPPNLVHNVIQHFSNYGKIEKYQEGSGNWITVTYETNSMALSALKSNGMAISKSYLIGVSLEKDQGEDEEGEIKHIVPMDVSNGVFKKPKNKHGLGSGKVGVSAENKDNAATGSFISRLKETFFGW